MPNYTFKSSDGSLVRKQLTLSQFKQVEAGEVSVVDSQTNEPLEIVFNPTNAIGMNMLDGPSGGWATQALKESKYRDQRGQVMAKRERDHVRKYNLVPNYEGQTADKWEDIQDHVRAEKGVSAAKTYNQVVAKEKAKT